MSMRKLSLLLTLVLIIGMISGCGTNTVTTSIAPTKDSIKLVLENDIATLDPLQSASLVDNRVFTNIFETLVKVDESNKILPVLAESWEISGDQKTYTFKLKKGVKFHNGEELKASDVVFTFNQGMKSPYQANRVGSVKEAKASGDNTIQVELKASDATFLLSLTEFYIHNEKAFVEGGKTYGEHPIGTGPYKFVKHDAGQRIVLGKFDGYHGKPAPINNVEFRVITDLNTALVALETGEVDFLYNIPKISKQDIAKNPKLSLHQYNSIRLYYVLMNTLAEPFKNQLVRQAMNYAINKESIVQVAEEGMGTVTKGIFSKDIFGYSDINGYKYDPQKAKGLLAEAGYPDGFKVTFRTMDGEFKKAAEIIQENLRAIGVTADIQVSEKNAYIQDLVKGNYQMGNLAVSSGKDVGLYSVIFKTGQQGNFSKYSNPVADQLFDKGKTTVREERLAIYAQLAQTLSDDAVVVPLYYPIGVTAGLADLKVGYINPTGILSVADMSWK